MEAKTVLGANGWRSALVASGVLLLVGGSMHPSSNSSKDSLREEFATMMSDDAWVPGHALVVVSAVLLAFGLFRVRRRGAWPNAADRALGIAAVAVAIYVVETVLHLFSYVDVDRLRDGDFAPVAFTHIGLAAVLYPLSGLAIAYLAWKLAPSWHVATRVFAYGGVVGGVLHALSVPMTLIFPDMETSPLFAFGAILIAIWTIAAGLVGVRAVAHGSTAPQPELVSR